MSLAPDSWGHTVPHDPTLPALLDHHATQTPDTVALVEDTTTLTFKALRDQVRAVAAGLSDLGVGCGDVVGLWLPNSIYWVQAALAASHLGAIAFGLNTRLRSREVLQALENARARVLITAGKVGTADVPAVLTDIAAALPDRPRHIVTVDATEDSPPALRDRLVGWRQLRSARKLQPTPPTPSRPAHAFSSSGTTSAPKLVLHTHAALVGHGYAVADRFGYHGQDTVVLGTLPFCGVFGYNTMIAALAAGRPLVIQASFNAEAAVTLMDRHSVTHTNLSDEMLRRIIAVPGALERLRSWREAGFGNFTAVDASSLVNAGVAVGKKFFQTYGSSELLALMCYPAPGSSADRWALGGGVPISEQIRVRIRDPQSREPLPTGSRGEIEVRGPNLTCGYLNNPGGPPLTEDGYLRTGDLGLLQDGEDLVYLSRTGDALRLGGFLVHPREIEECLEEDPAILEAQAVGLPAAMGAGVVGFVVLTPGQDFDEQRILERCRAQMARYKVPRRLLVLGSFPMAEGTNGNKIQRTKLRDMAATLLATAEAGTR